MTVDLQQTAIDIDSSSVNFSGPEYVAMLQDTQGNVLQSHGRENSIHLFLAFDKSNVAAAKKWIATVMEPLVTSAFDQNQAILAHRATGADAGLFANFGLSADGYRTLGIADAAIPDDPSFLRGAKHPDPNAPLGLNDPPVSEWQPGFQGEIDALVILADDDQNAVEAAAAQLVQGLAGVATVVDEERGQVLRNAAGEPIEHFGFADGVSQPLFMATDLEKARLISGLDVYDPSAPLGSALLKDPGGGPSGYGSYFVYRKLAQNVDGFNGDLTKLAQALGLPAASPDLAGAYVVGRFRDGTPVVAQPIPGWTTEPNDFDYRYDADGMRCPFQAHVRKVNPRGDKLAEYGLPPGEARSRRIARRGVPYPAPPPSGTAPPPEEVGLLFICAQSSIVHQFEFIQAIWSNFTQFLRPGTGLDPVIGQAPQGAAPVPQQWPKLWGVPFNGTTTFDFTPWVTMRGGEYFFLPSLSFLTGLGGEG
jgi:Dyp-type peroxidase family